MVKQLRKIKRKEMYETLGLVGGRFVRSDDRFVNGSCEFRRLCAANPVERASECICFLAVLAVACGDVPGPVCLACGARACCQPQTGYERCIMADHSGWRPYGRCFAR